MSKYLNRGVSTPTVIIFVIVLIVLLVGVVFAYSYYWMPKKETEAPKVETLEDETADWKTYTNTKYNYKIKVPQDFYNKVKPSAWVDSSSDDSITLYRGLQWYITIDYILHASSSNTKIITWLKQNFNWLDVPDKTNTEIDGISAVKIYYFGRPQAFNSDINFFIKDNKIFKIQALADIDDQNSIGIEEVKGTCDQILSTFKFIKEDESASREIYRDEEYGFEFKYPETLGQKYIREYQWPPK